MKKKFCIYLRVKTFLLVFFMIFIFKMRIIYCQSTVDPWAGQPNYYAPSPQTSDFMKYGNIPVGHYTGNLNLQIPIYNYKDKDFNVNVSLGYNSSGFVANKRSGIVGLDWFLNTGGAITREVVGVPDDLEVNHPTSTPPFVHGLWVGLRGDNQTYESSEIFNFTEGEETGHYDWGLGNTVTGYYETTSDIYSFNFMGISGKFIIGQDGKAHVYGTDASGTIKVDLAGMSNQYLDMDLPNSSTIIITTGDGYTYTFGGSAICLEYKMSVDIDLNPLDEFSIDPTIISWYLKEIVSPNGRKVTFEYYPFNEDFIPPSYDMYHYVLSKYPKSYSESYYAHNAYDLWIGSVSHSVKSSYSSENPTYELLKTTYLNKIKIDDDCEIEFYYSEKEKLFYQELNVCCPNIYSQKNLKIDSIEITSPLSNDIIRKAVFATSYKGAENKKRLFLDKVEIKGEKPYIFEYYTGSFPSPETRGMDYWGFWNGIDDKNADLIPSFNDPGGLGDIQYTSNEREPNTSEGVFNLGLLKKVTYPTGGYTSIEYQPHEYVKKLDRRSDNNFMPKLYDVTESYAGGARVYKLIDYDGQSSYNEREFLYLKNYNPATGSGISSGILMKWPRFLYAFSSDYFPGHGVINVVHVSNAGFSVDAADNEYITYSHVVEKKADNSFTEFQYSNYTTNPDDAVQNSENNALFGHTTVPSSLYRNIYRHPNCKSFERGKLTKIINYSSFGNPASEESFSYNRSGDEKYVASILLSGDKFFSRKDYTYSYVLTSETKKSYSMNTDGTYNSSYVETITTHGHNDYGQVASISTTQSDGTTKLTYYTYPQEISFSAYNGGDCNAYCEDISDLYNDCRSGYWNFTNGQCTYGDYNCAEDGITSECFNYLPAGYESCVSSGMPYTFDQSVCRTICENGLSTPAKLLLKMKDKNMISLPVQVLEKTGGNVVSGSYTAYKELSSGAIVPDRTSAIETTTPLASVTAPYVNSSGVLVKSGNFKEKVYYDIYDDDGNLLQYHKKGDISTSYIWRYNNSLPIAKIENADHDEVAYTSFEPGANGGNWYRPENLLVSGGITGERCLLTEATIPCTAQLNPSKSYKLTFYAKGNNNICTIDGDNSGVLYINLSSEWDYYEVVLEPGNTSIEMEVGVYTYFDELRLYPSDAQMRSYTYDPLIGITSESDERGVPIHYIYDEFGRLEKILDQDRNVLKQYNYHYKGQ